MGGVFFQTDFTNFSELAQTMVILVYNHKGYQIRIPLVTSNDFENTSSMMMTAGIALVANVGSYFLFKNLVKKRTKHIKKSLDIAFARFSTRTDQVNSYLLENQLFINSSFNNETRCRGLVIIEAYYGLADHIYQIEAGLIIYRLPETADEFSKC